MSKLPGMGAPVRIADFAEAGEFAGRYGVCYGGSHPSSSGVGPVMGALHGGSSREDFAIFVFFEETGEQKWFAPHLVELDEEEGR